MTLRKVLHQHCWNSVYAYITCTLMSSWNKTPWKVSWSFARAHATELTFYESMILYAGIGEYFVKIKNLIVRIYMKLDSCILKTTLWILCKYLFLSRSFSSLLNNPWELYLMRWYISITLGDICRLSSHFLLSLLFFLLANPMSTTNSRKPILSRIWHESFLFATYHQ